jgi:hypothetical protein
MLERNEWTLPEKPIRYFFQFVIVSGYRIVRPLNQIQLYHAECNSGLGNERIF